MIIIPANTLSTGGFNIDNSVRFNGANHDLRIVPGSVSNRRTMTISFWTKRSSLGGTGSGLISSWGDGYEGGFASMIYFNDTDQLEIDHDIAGSDYNFHSDMVFRDVSAWYHIVIAIDTTQGTEANRQKIYVNGTQITLTETALGFPPEDFDTFFNNTLTTVGGSAYEGGSGAVPEYSGYFSEFVMIDGTALAADQFGEFDSDSGIWKPIDVSGLTFGTNGFYLEFKESGTSQNASGLGADTSGNTNHLAVTALTATDQSTDTCTNNFCTLNPLTKRSGGTLTEGNLQYTASTADSSIFGTMAIPPGMKVYFEVKLVSNTAQNAIGIHNVYDPGGTFVKGGSASGMYSFKPRGSGSVTQYFNNGSSTDTGTSNYANDTIIGVAVDNANGQIHYHAAGTYINSSDPTDNDPVALVTGFGGASEQYLHFSLDTTTTQPSNQFNFGSPPYSESGGNSDGNGYGNFNQAVPSGYYSLNTKNLSEFT